MPKSNFFVSKNTKGGWKVSMDGTPIGNNFQRQDDAVNYAKDFAKMMGGEVTIQGRDGKIRSKDSYGNDPISIRDKEH